MLGARLARCAFDAFDSAKVGRPGVRDNGVSEWTVMAAVVSLNTANDEVLPVCVATGVKVMPDQIRHYSHGTIVQDLHAEVLALRLFNWHLLDEMARDDSYWFERVGKLVQLKTEIKLALVVSEPPCGDASMSLGEGVPWEESKRLKLPNGTSVLRGRANYDLVGTVRTKPGRLDSPPTLSKSCSDKLCVKQLLGLSSSFTSLVLAREIFLDYLVVPTSTYSQEDFDRCFNHRFPVDSHRMKILTYDDPFEFHKTPGSVPSMNSLLYVPLTTTVQVLNNGVKNGAYRKNHPPKYQGQSMVCNQRMWEKLKAVHDVKFHNYQDLKLSNKKRQQLKTKAREVLGGWVPTSIDDFCIDID